MRNTSIAALAIVLISISSSSHAGPVTSPGAGSIDRKEILDEIRPEAEKQLGRPVEFVVTTLKTWDGWAFAILKAQRPGGKPIPASETIFEPGEIDNYTIFALLQDTSKGWLLTEYDLAPTEPSWMAWKQQYGLPAGLF